MSSALLSSLRKKLVHSTSYDNISSEWENESIASPAKSTTLRVLVAYSGGLDSHVLLHLLSQLPPDEISLRAVYVNHGLQTEAQSWAEHCETTCRELAIPYKSIDLNLTVSKGESLEEIARKGRYHALYSDLRTDEILVTAHHQSDQAETLLLQLLRGSGVQGLAAMASDTEVNFKGESHRLCRPLLDQSRSALEAYVSEHKLNHIDDPSNLDTAFDRNYLRQDIIPLLKQRWLGFDKALSRTAALQAETKVMLDEVAEEELPDILSEQLEFSKININSKKLFLAPISIIKLLKKSENKQRLLLRYWISQQGFLAPSAKKLEHIFLDLIDTPDDKQPLITWKGVELRRFKHHIYIMSPLSEHDASQLISWDTDTDIHISSINTTLHVALRQRLNKRFSDENNGTKSQVTIRFRQGGESISIPKRGNVALKNLMQEKQVPPWLRSRLPLVYNDDQLVEIVGLTHSLSNDY